VLVPALLGWRYGELDPELRKSFEVALHAGTALALMIGLRREVAEVIRELDARRLARHGLEMLPPAAAALAFERPIEQRLGVPRRVAAAQIVAGVALALADRSPTARSRDQAGPLDGLAIGIAQATALAPGVSRNGATLTAARLRGFRRRDANVLSRHVALPVIVGATALKGTRLARRGLPPGLAGAFAAGAGASFASTLASVRIIRAVERERPFVPWAAYRAALGVLVLRRACDNRAR
jgi:undecaprenyl-diphosphatase